MQQLLLGFELRALVHPAPRLVFATRNGAVLDFVDLEPNSNDLTKPGRQPLADRARSLPLKPVLSRKVHLGYLTKATLGSQDNLIVADLGESEDRLVHGLRPDIDALDLAQLVGRAGMAVSLVRQRIIGTLSR